MGTITIDLWPLGNVTSVEVAASGVTGHTVIVNDHGNPDVPMKAAGATVTTVTDAQGRKLKKATVTI